MDEYIERVERNADAEWKDAALTVVKQLAGIKDHFTTDAVWFLLERDHADVATHEPRAVGAVMRRAVAEGWVRPTDDYARSTRPECHKRPLRVWASRLR